jgi:hypothetical protein
VTNIEKPNLTPEQLARPLKTGDLPGLMKAIAPAFREFLEKAVQPLAQRIVELESCVAELKETQLKYFGVWDREKNYPPNSMVTDQGAAWISKIEVRGARPGDGNVAWRLAVKRAREK